MTWVFYKDHRSYLEGATSAGDIVCTYNPVNGPKLVGIWGYRWATSVQILIYKGSPYTKIFLKILWGLLFWLIRYIHFLAALWPEISGTGGWMGLSASVRLYWNCFFSARLSLILTKLDMDDRRATKLQSKFWIFV